MTEDLYPDLEYTENHRAEQNGVGDYRMVCPSVGIVPGFIPFFMRTMQRVCKGCGKSIGFVQYKQEGN